MSQGEAWWMLFLAAYGVGTLARQLKEFLDAKVLESKWRAARRRRVRK